jgi:arsenate reductase
MATLFRIIVRALIISAIGGAALAVIGGVCNFLSTIFFGHAEGTFAEGAFLGFVYGASFGPLGSILIEWFFLDVHVSPPTFRIEHEPTQKEKDHAILDDKRELPPETKNRAIKNGKPVVMFLCTENAARSQMAEAFLKKYASDAFDVFSAGMEATEIHPLTVQVMNESGIDISRQRAKSLKYFLGKLPVRLAITVCAPVEINCPTTWPGALSCLVWPFENPAAYIGSEDERIAKFRKIRDQIDGKIKSWLKEMAAPATPI